LTKAREPLPLRTCACGQDFQPRQHNSRYCSPACHSKSRESRGRSEASQRARAARKKQIDNQRALDNLAATEIIALDGEGCTQPEYTGDGEAHTDPDDSNFWENHKYQYMSSWLWSVQESRFYDRIEAAEGDRLHTGEILRWLWKVTAKSDKNGPARSPWFFGAKYDWTAIFRDIIIQDVVSGDAVKSGTLWQVMHPDQYPDGLPRQPFDPVWWLDEEGNWWGITYIQGVVNLSRRYWSRKENVWKSLGQRHFADASRCFGPGSFVFQLESWEVGTEQERSDVARMKQERGHFSRITQEVRDYCDLEMKLLAELVKKVTMIYGSDPINLRPRSWWSAGSSAKCLMDRHNIPRVYDKEHNLISAGAVGPDRYAGAPDDIKTVLLRAYVGGWFENAETGLFEELHSEDFKSMYPSVIKHLPCFSHGHWEHGYVPGAVNIGHVEWEPSHDGPLRWAPFPWRYPDGGIYRPSHGEGWYHEVEVRAAQRLSDYDITELEWVSFVPECDHEPWLFVQDVYDQRVAWGGDGRGLALKTTLNSVYGTLADTLTLDSRYASIVCAGLITAGCRAKILDLIADHGDKIVSVATDGILATSPVLGVKTKVLGQLNYEGPIYDVLLIQPGLHLAASGPDPKKTIRNRGHGLADMREIEDQLRDQWRLRGWNAQVAYKRTRFIPAKLALARTDPLKVYGQWLEQEVTLKFKPSNREPVDDPGLHKCSEPSSRHIGHILRKYPEQWDMLCSAPYDKFVSMMHNEELIAEREMGSAQP
jgi:hypothetical protein